MTAFFLLVAIRNYLRDVVGEYAAAQGQGGGFRKPEVFEWFLPFKNPRHEEKIDFPYIVVRPTDGQDLTDESTVQVELSFGVYNEGTPRDGTTHPDGAYDLLNLMEHIRIALFRKSVLDSRFRIEKPYKWQIPAEQPYPLWVGQAQTVWTVAAPIQQFGKDGFLHG